MRYNNRSTARQSVRIVRDVLPVRVVVLVFVIFFFFSYSRVCRARIGYDYAWGGEREIFIFFFLSYDGTAAASQRVRRPATASSPGGRRTDVCYYCIFFFFQYRPFNRHTGDGRDAVAVAVRAQRRYAAGRFPLSCEYIITTRTSPPFRCSRARPRRYYENTAFSAVQTFHGLIRRARFILSDNNFTKSRAPTRNLYRNISRRRRKKRKTK